MVDQQSSAASFSGKTIVVTGGASGMGLAITELLVAEGAHVIALDRSEAVNDLGDMVTGIRVDLTDLPMLKSVVEGFPEVDGLVNAAGIMISGDIFTVTPEEWDRTMDINLKGVFFMTQYTADKLVPGSSVVHISSIGGVSAVNYSAAAYHASKGAVITMTKSWARALAPRQVRVNSVLPGVTDTPMLQAIFEKQAAASGEDVESIRTVSAASVPVGHLAEPREIAEVVAFLLSPKSSYITGTAINASGGAVM